MSSVESIKNKKARVVVDAQGRPVGGVNYPGFYHRQGNFESSGSIITTPTFLAVSINGTACTSNSVSLNLNNEDDWDDSSVTTASSRAGLDVKLFAVSLGSTLKFRFSTQSTMNNAVAVAGFHCLCEGAGTISGSLVSDLDTGDIIPNTIWDINHKPVSSPEGMAYCKPVDLWVDIYMNSLVSDTLKSVFGGTVETNLTASKITGEKAIELLSESGKRLPTRDEFVVFSAGSNVGTAISASSTVAGGHFDSESRRMVSSYGVEDCCGFLLQPTSTLFEYLPFASIKDNVLDYTDPQTDSVYNSTSDIASKGASDGFIRRAYVGGCAALSYMSATDCGPRSIIARNMSSWLDTEVACVGCRGVSPNVEKI